MLVIKPIENKSIQKEMVETVASTYREAALAYAAYDCEEDGETVRFPIGVCQFSLSEGKGIIDTLRPFSGVDDEEALMIMARACTSFLFRCGFKTAVLLPQAAERSLANKLEFIFNEDGTADFDVFGYYTGPCHGCNG